MKTIKEIGDTECPMTTLKSTVQILINFSLIVSLTSYSVCMTVGVYIHTCVHRV